MGLPAPTTSGLTIFPVDCFARIAARRGAVWLDSSLSRPGWGQQSVLATDPVAEYRLGATGAEVVQDGRAVDLSRTELFDRLEAIRRSPNRLAIGYVSYEACLDWLSLIPTSVHPHLPLAHFFEYDRHLTYNHLTGTFSDPDLAVEFLDSNDWTEVPKASELSRPAQVQGVTDRAKYLAKVRKIKEHIREGDIYQANLTCRHDVRSDLPPFAAYMRLRRFNPAAYSAYLNFGDYQVLSSSPERLFLWDNSRITSSPIKGTIARGHDPKSERDHRMRLAGSEKDRAELLMIVDLVRNDLGKIANTGSVEVKNLFRIDKLSAVYHLVADIVACTGSDITLSDVLAALLPGGSITGAPKRRAVEILSEIEDCPRSVYTGSIGSIGMGRADFNIAIRTMSYHEGLYQIHAGGGIVADSEPEAELEEMMLKAGNLLRATGVRN